MNTPDDLVNIAVNLANMPNISSLNLCIPNPTLMQLLLFCKLKIKFVFIVRFVIYFYLHHSSFVVSIFDILYHFSLCQNLFPKLHLFLVPNILTFVVIFLSFKFHVFIRFELIHIDQHMVSFKLFNGHQ